MAKPTAAELRKAEEEGRKRKAEQEAAAAAAKKKRKTQCTQAQDPCGLIPNCLSL